MKQLRYGLLLTGFVAGVLVVTSCVDVGQQGVSVLMRVAGTSVEDPIDSKQGWSIELRRAQLAFGPLYLCAGYQAGGLCETARAEWIDSAVVDALDERAHAVGELTGISGTVRSWMYDLGITSLLTQQRPEVLASAESLGGSSVRLEGIAHKAAHEISFVVEIPISQEEATEIGVCIVRKSGSDRFEHEITGDEAALTVRFDPRDWVRDIDFDEVVEDAACSSACTHNVSFEATSQGARAVRAALVAGERPQFEWSDAP